MSPETFQNEVQIFWPAPRNNAYMGCAHEMRTSCGAWVAYLGRTHETHTWGIHMWNTFCLLHVFGLSLLRIGINSSGVIGPKIFSCTLDNSWAHFLMKDSPLAWRAFFRKLGSYKEISKIMKIGKNGYNLAIFGQNGSRFCTPVESSKNVDLLFVYPKILMPNETAGSHFVV